MAIEVVEGRLGNVLAQGNERYSLEVLAEPFEDLVDAPVTNAGIEEAILSLIVDKGIQKYSPYPGLQLQAVFRPGREVGTSDLLLGVREEKPYHVAFQVDNNGGRFTGERRALADFYWNNPFGVGDRLDLRLIQNYLPKNSVFYSVQYHYPILPTSWFEFGASRQIFDVGAEQRAINLSGETKSLNARFWHNALLTRFHDLRLYLGLDRQDALTKRNAIIVNEDNIASLEAGLEYQRVDTEYSGFDSVTLSFSQGLDGLFGGMSERVVNTRAIPPSRRGNKGNFASNDFYRLAATYARTQSIDEDKYIQARLQGQWSNSLLPSVAQFPIGGPDSVRAYPASEFLRDTAVFTSLEWFWRAPGFAQEEAWNGRKWGDILSVSFFADYAAGTLNQPTAGDVQNIDVSGYGAAAHITLSHLRARLQVAHPLSGAPPSDARATHWWFDVRYEF
ncbi:MAG: hypothetical protein GKR94_22855 [Gammaproteobacteria bacterium]|nr:hypothetical protein [Gammaproteobacteria bacterium]